MVLLLLPPSVLAMLPSLLLTSLPDITRLHQDPLAALPDRPALSVPGQRLPHVERVRVVVVVADHAPVDRVAHLAVHLDRGAVLDPDEEVDEPGLVGVGGPLERGRQPGRVPEPPGPGRDGQRRDVSVPGQVVRVRVRGGRVGFHGGGERGGFEFAEDFFFGVVPR